MKRLSASIFALCVGLSVLADEPPCWCEFSIPSDNNEFRADIEFDKADSLKKAWDRTWTITVYSIRSDTSFFWTSLFKHDGYGGGSLSNDGKIYTYVNDWLEMEHPNQVVLYTSDTIIQLSGSDVGLIASAYPNTISHQIWLDNYQLIPDLLSDTTKLFLETLDNQLIELDINTLTVIKKKAHPEYVGQVDLIRKLGIGLLIFIGIGVTLLALKKLTKHNKT